MPDWFTPAVVILGLVALGLFVAYWQTRKRQYAFGLLAAVGFIILAWLIAHFLPTDRKAIESAIDDMAAGVKNRNTDQVFAHIAKNFRFHSHNRDSFRQLVEPHIR